MSTARKLAVAAASVALGWGAMENQSAQAATITGPTTWNLSFFEGLFEDSEQVGSGQFSVEREAFEGTLGVAQDTSIRRIDPDQRNLNILDTVSIDESDNFHSLNRFSANISGISWDLSDSGKDNRLFLVPPEGNTLPSAGIRNVNGGARRPSLNITRGWGFGAGSGAELISQAQLTFNKGSFWQTPRVGSEEEATTGSIRGYWTAQRVPEPSTIAGTLLAGGALGAWRLRKRKARAG